MSSDESSDKECPLCMEPFDFDDINFYPCTCQYQICRFCWHRLRTAENGLCPACRQPYPENPVNFQPLTNTDLQRIKTERKQARQQQKTRPADSRKHLSNYRVLQKNLVYVVGLSQKMADVEVLRKHEYFGKYGKLVKIAVGTSPSTNGSQSVSCTAYVTYGRVEDALRAIEAVNNLIVEGRLLKASLGTTKYCSTFLRGQMCHKTECMYLHEIADEEISFTKEDMHAGRHTEYERKLHEQLGGGRLSQSTTHTTAQQLLLHQQQQQMLLQCQLNGSPDTTKENNPQQQPDKPSSSVSSSTSTSASSTSSTTPPPIDSAVSSVPIGGISNLSSSPIPALLPSSATSASSSPGVLLGGRKRTETTSSTGLPTLDINHRSLSHSPAPPSSSSIADSSPPPTPPPQNLMQTSISTVSGTVLGVHANSMRSSPDADKENVRQQKITTCDELEQLILMESTSSSSRPESSQMSNRFENNVGKPNNVPESSGAMPNFDDDLGFDPFSESSKALAELVLEEQESRTVPRPQPTAKRLPAFPCSATQRLFERHAGTSGLPTPQQQQVQQQHFSSYMPFQPTVGEIPPRKPSPQSRLGGSMMNNISNNTGNGITNNHELPPLLRSIFSAYQSQQPSQPQQQQPQQQPQQLQNHHLQQQQQQQVQSNAVAAINGAYNIALHEFYYRQHLLFREQAVVALMQQQHHQQQLQQQHASNNNTPNMLQQHPLQQQHSPPLLAAMTTHQQPHQHRAFDR